MDEVTADVHIILASTSTSSYTNKKSNEIDINSEECLRDQQFSTVADKTCFKMTTTCKHRWSGPHRREKILLNIVNNLEEGGVGGGQ